VTTSDVIDSEFSTPQIQYVKEGTYKRIDNSKNDDVVDDTFVVDNTGNLYVNIGRIKENMPEGRCIVDLAFMLKEIRRIRIISEE